MPRGPPRRRRSRATRRCPAKRVEVAALVHPSFTGEYAALIAELNQIFREMGFILRPINKRCRSTWRCGRRDDVDVVIGRWASDYPDADTSCMESFKSQEGFMGLFSGTPEIDALGVRGRAGGGPAFRHSIYRQVEEIIARDALADPALPRAGLPLRPAGRRGALTGVLSSHRRVRKALVSARRRGARRAAKKIPGAALSFQQLRTAPENGKPV